MTRWDCKTLFEMYDELRHALFDRESRGWLMTPHVELGGRAPCELISTPTGYQRVRRLLDARLKSADM